MNSGGPFRGPPAFPPPLRFGQAAVFGQGGGAGLPFAPAAFGPPYGLGQAPAFAAAGSSSGAPAGNAGFSFKPPTNLGSFPGSGDAAAGGGGGSSSSGAFAAPEFRFKAPESGAAAFKPLAGAEAEKGPAAPAAFTFSPPFGFAPEAGPEAAAAAVGGSGPFSFSRPAAALGRPEEKGPRPFFEETGEPAPKGLKRKEERERSPRRATAAAAGGRAAAAAPPEKRAVLLSRPRGGALFGRTLQEVLRSQGRGHRDRGDAAEAERGAAEEAPPPPAEAREIPREGRLGQAERSPGHPRRPGVTPLSEVAASLSRQMSPPPPLPAGLGAARARRGRGACRPAS